MGKKWIAQIILCKNVSTFKGLGCIEVLQYCKVLCCYNLMSFLLVNIDYVFKRIGLECSFEFWHFTLFSFLLHFIYYLRKNWSIFDQELKTSKFVLLKYLKEGESVHTVKSLLGNPVMIKSDELIENANPVIIWVHIAVVFILKLANILSNGLRGINKISCL